MTAPQPRRHTVVRHDAATPGTPTIFQGRSRGYAQIAQIDGSGGAVHASVGTAILTSGGSVELHHQSYEELVFVLEGNPVLELDGRRYVLAPDDCACIPVGVPHAWSNPGSTTCKWIVLQSPIPRSPDRPADTFFVSASGAEAGGYDPRRSHLAKFSAEQMDVRRYGPGFRDSAPGANLGGALQAFSGATLKMLVDARQGAFHANMFMIEFQPGMALGMHDHPLEETFYVLEGEVAAVMDGSEYLLRVGDVALAGVGCLHVFENRSDRTCRWLETRSPLPPYLHEARFERDWAR